MSKNRAVRSSQQFKPTRNKYNNRRSKSQDNFKSREKPKYKSGAKPNNRVRDSGRDEVKRRPSSHSKRRASSQSVNRTFNKEANRHRISSDRRSIEFHTTTCDKCNKETQVPFKPTGVKPVLCRECFQDQKQHKKTRRPSDRSRRRTDKEIKQLHTVICIKCKRETQVPFKPTGIKPVYCRECFQEQKRSEKVSESLKELPKIENEVVERFGDREGPYRANKRMHQTRCRICEREIMIPFKPKKGKTIYCQECFSKIEKSEKIHQ